MSYGPKSYKVMHSHTQSYEVMHNPPKSYKVMHNHTQSYKVCKKPDTVLPLPQGPVYSIYNKAFGFVASRLVIVMRIYLILLGNPLGNAALGKTFV